MASAIATVALALPHGAFSAKVYSNTTAPNIVFILTDDQRADTLWAMRHTQQKLVPHGVTFDNAMVVNTLCCPSRASILTGNYSHTTGVYGNGGAHGGFGSFDDSSTVATWLDDAGYQTALIGKYLNGYSQNYIPPGWDEWDAFYQAGASGGKYYDYSLNEDGTIVPYGSDPGDYSTTVLANKADAWLRSADPSQPVFLYLGLFSGHSPYTPEPKYEHALRDLQPYRPPNYNEADVSDKPQWVRKLPLLTPDKQKQVDRQRRNAYRALLSADDAVSLMVQALTDTGRLSNTMIVFASDNGLAVGEHRWTNKKVAYEEGLRVPLVIRYDPLTFSTPRNDSHIALNIDWAPTFAELAGITPPATEGTSLIPLLESPSPPSWRTDFLIEHRHENVRDELPTYCAVRTEDYLYVDYLTTGEEELYDLNADPYELENKVTDPAYEQVRDQLRTRDAELCQPQPPP